MEKITGQFTTVENVVKQSINNYPSLYLTDNYEDSKFKVLHHIFIVLGNGFDWAEDKDENSLGYLTRWRYEDEKNRYDEWVKIPDREYNKDESALDINHLFTEPVYSVQPNRSAYENIENYLKDVHNSKLPKYVLEVPEKYRDHKKYSTFLCSRNSKRVHPYPNFNFKYSKFWEKGANNIQEDWRVAAIEHLTSWIEYFSDLNLIETKKQNNHFLKKENRDSALKYIDQTVQHLESLNK